MTNPGRTSEEKQPRLATTLAWTVIIIALLTAYALLTTPDILKPNSITVAGTITTLGEKPTKIVFINTSCGTRTEAALCQTNATSASYTATLSNHYIYNVYISHNAEREKPETQIGTLTLNTAEPTITRNWTTQP